MKATLITNEYPPNIYGGAGVHADYLSRALAKKINIDVRCFSRDTSEDSETSPSLDITRYPFWENVLEGGDKKFRGALKAITQNILMASRDFDSDIVHTHTWYASFAGFLLKLLHNVPLVTTIHSLEPLRPWKREQLGNAYNVSSWVEKNTIENADAVIAVSEETRADVLRHFNVDEKKIHVIHNGIDLDEYQKVPPGDTMKKYGISADTPFVLFVGRITRQKGIIHLVRAIQHIDPETQVVLCAGMPDTPEIDQEMRSSVENIQKERKNIHWIDTMLPKNEVIELYSNATVFCCPSVYEPFGIINLEAMACETAVAASAVGGIKEVVIPEETGLLVDLELKDETSFEPVHPEKFSRDLADAINRIVRDDSLREKMGKAGRKRVEDIFSWDSIAEKTRTLYTSLCSK